MLGTSFPWGEITVLNLMWKKRKSYVITYTHLEESFHCTELEKMGEQFIVQMT